MITTRKIPIDHLNNFEWLMKKYFAMTERLPPANEEEVQIFLAWCDIQGFVVETPKEVPSCKEC